jgi:hypothetical protein
MNIRAFLILFISFLALASVQCQDITSKKEFFESRLVDYSTWLKNTHLATIISLDTLSVLPGKVILNLKIKDKHNWERLVSIGDSAYHQSVPGSLYNHFAFTMDLKDEHAEIDIDATDATIIIQRKDGNIKTELWKKMGEISSDVDLPIEGLIDISNINTFQSNKSIEALKAIIQKGLKNYFVKYKAKMEEYQCVPLYELDNSLIIGVNNIVDAVLKEGYFEHLQFNFNFSQQPGKVLVTYEMFGKYGAGMIWAPQNSRYHDMLPKYQEQFKLFNLIISNEIGKIVK